MKAVAVKELKNRLSSYLREVKAGEIVLVTDRGQVVAELRQPSTSVAPGAHDRALERLAVAAPPPGRQRRPPGRRARRALTIYAETSAVLRWLLGEAGGVELRESLAAATKVTVSRLTLVEARRVVRRAEREGRLTAAQSADVLAILAQAASTWAILAVTEEVMRRAEEGFPSEPVRTLDAVHLASALFLRQSFPDLILLTADERVRANASLLGFQTAVAER
jgi:antitoxin (DNA-binding transcriptional repressor) of toxin-antitoxin stability system/uncharacterized protein with PIN domain